MSEIEKQFFETFGIEPKLLITKDDWEKCKNLPKAEELFKQYPKITDSILLELICILTEWRQYCASDYIIKAINIDILKNDILKDCLYMLNWNELKKVDKDIKHQVQALFKENT